VSAAAHALEQLVVEAFVGQENGARRLHARNRRRDVPRRGKQELLHRIDLVAEAKQPEAGLKHTDIGLAAGENLGVIPDFPVLGQIEEILSRRLPIALF
jgi:hypothetical protein